MKQILTAIALFGCFVLLTAETDCNGKTEADIKMDRQQELLSSQAVAQVGMPGVTNFTEKKIVRKLYELRDQNVSTFSYVMDMQGRLWHVCDSIGYGLPYGVQFTNPHRAQTTGGNGIAMADQAEPNGLFMPSTAEGTWVLCASEKRKGDIEPMYIEPRVVVSPYRLNAAGDWQVK